MTTSGFMKKTKFEGKKHGHAKGMAESIMFYCRDCNKLQTDSNDVFKRMN